MTGPEPSALEQYALWALSLHQLCVVEVGRMPMCSCGSPAILCPYRTRAADLGVVRDRPVRPSPRPRPGPGWDAFTGRPPPP